MPGEFFFRSVKVKLISKVRADFVSFSTIDKNCVVHIRSGCEELFLCPDYSSSYLKLSLGERIKCRRVSLNMTQQDLSKESGITQAMIAIIESDKSEPGYKNILKLKKALGVDINFFDER